MEPPAAATPAPSSHCAGGASARAILATAFRAWRRNVGPLTLLAAAADLPLLALELDGGRTLALSSVSGWAMQGIAWLIGATVLTAEGLRAVRGERLRIGSTFGDLRGCGRVLRAHAVAYAAPIAGAVAVSVAMAFDDTSGPFGSGPERFMLWVLGVALLAVAIQVHVLPLSAVALDRAEIRASEAARHARRLTRGRRGAMLLVALLLAAAIGLDFLAAPTSRAAPAVIVARRALLALAYGFLGILPAAAYVRLAEEKAGATLAKVFE